MKLPTYIYCMKIIIFFNIFLKQNQTELFQKNLFEVLLSSMQRCRQSGQTRTKTYVPNKTRTLVHAFCKHLPLSYRSNLTVCTHCSDFRCTES